MEVRICPVSFQIDRGTPEGHPEKQSNKKLPSVWVAMPSESRQTVECGLTIESIPQALGPQAIVDLKRV